MDNNSFLTVSVGMFVLLVFGGLSEPAYAQFCNSAITPSAPDDRFEVEKESTGSQVKDRHTGLIWQRCSFGQKWNGSTCEGVATKHAWSEALKLASSYGNSWRLPNIKELKGFLEVACYAPAVNAFIFPNTPAYLQGGYDSYWSSSVDLQGGAWYVDIFDGYSAAGSKNYMQFYIRAVKQP